MASVHKREGSTFYSASISVGGVRKRITTGERNRREAQKKADRIEQIENEALEATASIKLLNAADQFFNHRAIHKPLRPKTIEGYKASLANVCGILGDFHLASLTKKDIQTYVTARLKNGHNVALINDLAFLSSVYRYGAHYDPPIEMNPVKEFDKSDIARATEHKTWLRPQQVETVLNSCTQQYQRLFIMLATMTGMRSSEVRLLTWSEIDLEDETITLANLDAKRTKNGESRIIPIPEQVVAELRIAQKTRSKENDYVLNNPRTGKPYTTFKTFWAGVRKRSGLTTIRIHDLRHTYASWAKQQDMDEITIMTIMGHKTRSMVKRYAHVSKDHLKVSVKKFEGMKVNLARPANPEE